MAHSVELLFDQDTEAAVVQDWTALAEAGLPSQAHHRSPTNRPHVTLTVGQRIDPAVDAALRETAMQLPLGCLIGAPMVFGRTSLTLVRLIVPSAGLLQVHQYVDAICAPHLTPEAYPHARPGRWTPHVTLGRRLMPSDLPEALEVIGRDHVGRDHVGRDHVGRDHVGRDHVGKDYVAGTFAALRRWDGDARVDTLIA